MSQKFLLIDFFNSEYHFWKFHDSSNFCRKILNCITMSIIAKLFAESDDLSYISLDCHCPEMLDRVTFRSLCCNDQTIWLNLIFCRKRIYFFESRLDIARIYVLTIRDVSNLSSSRLVFIFRIDNYDSCFLERCNIRIHVELFAFFNKLLWIMPTENLIKLFKLLE